MDERSPKCFAFESSRHRPSRFTQPEFAAFDLSTGPGSGRRPLAEIETQASSSHRRALASLMAFNAVQNAFAGTDFERLRLGLNSLVLRVNASCFNLVFIWEHRERRKGLSLNDNHKGYFWFVFQTLGIP